MWKFNRHAIGFFILLFSGTTGYSQNCDLQVSGFVKDLSTGAPIPYANIYLKEIQTGVVSDTLGFITLESLCPGKYHLAVSHIGCETIQLFLNIHGDTSLTIFLDHNSQLLDEVAVVGESGSAILQESQSINSENISRNTEKALGEMLENIAGVSTIRNGSGISKPVVHGLYGNRLSIINNGITQGGQQWGVDHSPEIDALAANRITVIKGVGALEYQGSSLGSVVLVEPEKINQEPHLHGEGRYFFESNGLANGLNLELQRYHKSLAWRLVGTIKKSGDKRTSKYYLRNTGSESANFALQLEKAWTKRIFTELYFSSFNANYGVLRGSHIGNLTDLEAALERDVPFFTEKKFSYSISSPSQKVNHQLFKLHSKYSLSEKQELQLTYGLQYDLRKEFDVRRSGRSEIPALSLEQTSNFLEGKYSNYLARNWVLKSGVQINRISNINLPETGILPIIPDYISNKLGAFALLRNSGKKTSFELAGRYDFESRNVAAISISTPREIVRYEAAFHNMSAMLGLAHKFTPEWKSTLNIGYKARNPEINELYSNGLHQGVSGIEEGDPNLNRETSIKSTLSLTGQVKNKLFVEGLVYLQYIQDYIYLSPQDEIRLTIRGAFPVFRYEQTDAQLTGFDIKTSFQATDRFNVMGKYSFIYGYDRTNDLPLVFMPSNNLIASFKYQFPSIGKIEKLEFELNNRYVFEQKDVLPSQDFVAPPGSYYLLGARLSAERQLKKMRVSVHIKAENLLNETYRDYLNRQRYFANDLGLNLILGLRISF